MIIIAVASSSVFKIDPVHASVAALNLTAEVIPDESPSESPPQPMGMRQIIAGAYSRAWNLLPRAPKGAYVIAVENGLTLTMNGHVDIAHGLIMTPSGYNIGRDSESVPVPEELARMVAAEYHQCTTAGKLEAARSGSNHADPHRVWSGGVTDRKTILTALVTDLLRTAIQIEAVHATHHP